MQNANLTAKIRDVFLGVPLSVKVMGIAVSMILLLGACAIWQIQHSYYRLEEHEVEEYAQLIANVLAQGSAPMLRQADLGAAQQLLNSMAQATTAISAIQLRDRGGRLIASTGSLHSGEREYRGTAMLANDIGGNILVALNDDHIDFEIGWHTRRIIAMTTLTVVFSIAVTWLLLHIVTRPIHALVQTTRTIKGGNYQARAKVYARDEVGELAEAFNEMMATLQRKEDINQQLLRKLIAITEEERKWVSHELHEQTSQELTSLLAGIAVLEQGSQPQTLRIMNALASHTLGGVRDLSMRLHPPALDELGLMPALQQYCRDVARNHLVNVDCNAIGLESSTRLSKDVELALYRIGQEALTNAVLHGGAMRMEVLIQRKGDSVSALIEDDGRGFEAGDWRAACLREDHAGLLGMEERAVLLGGTLQIESRPGAGTRIYVDIPLKEAVSV